jgi:hypothetical protein
LTLGKDLLIIEEKDIIENLKKKALSLEDALEEPTELLSNMKDVVKMFSICDTESLNNFYNLSEKYIQCLKSL